jgi:hypothetical protein
LLNEQIQDQFLEDGWYAQHSFQYMRLALEQSLLAQRALQRAGLTLEPRSIVRLGAALDLITALVDSETGVVPNFGASDGSRVLPLSSAGYRDFRPLLTLAALVLGRPLPSDIPADSEVLAWIGGELPPPGPPRIDGTHHGEKSGWVVVRFRGVVAFIRAGEFSHRPSHIDLLHLNLTVDGRELIVDPGTFSYNSAYPWKNGLALARVHNAPLLNGCEPVAKGPRFLWLDWPSSRLVEASHRADGVRIVVEVPNKVRREVNIRREEVVVTDVVLDAGVEFVQVSWLLHPEVSTSTIVRAEGATEVRPCADVVDAWFSPTYLKLMPSRMIRVRRERIQGEMLQVCTTIDLTSS